MSSGKSETRQAILEAALRLFQERRASAVRLVDIARRAGVTRQAVYLHFGSRSGLLVSLVQYVDEKEELAEAAKPVWKAATAVDALERFAALHAEYTPRIYPVAQALLASRHEDEDSAAAWDDRMEGRRDACRRLVRWLRRDGALDSAWDVDQAADALWALTSIQVWEQLVVDQGWPKERYEAYLRLTLRRTFVMDAG